MSSKRKTLPSEPVAAHIDDLDPDGRGVARIDGKVVFIDGALPGEDVMFRYRRIRGRFDEGVVDEVLDPAPQRVQARCPHFGVCGGCAMQHLNVAAQIDAKQERLLEHFEHFGQVHPDTVLPPVTAEPWGYRRKARLGVKYVAKKGGVLVGFREKRSNLVAQLEHCDVLHPSVGRRLTALKSMLGALGARACIPQIEVAVGDNSTALVFRHLDPLSDADIAALQAFGQTEDLHIYLQPGGPDTVSVLWPPEAPPLSYRLAEYDVEIEFLPTDFTQVNADINRALVPIALGLLEPGPDERILDLFCGLGNFTLPLARSGGDVVGLEGSESLVARARHNARRNGLDNVVFEAVDLTDQEQRRPWLVQRWDKLFLDPPRSGAQEIVEDLAPPYPVRLVYVSCNPATLARDSGVLVAKHDFRLVSAGVVDMFPHTTHAESIALFERD